MKLEINLRESRMKGIIEKVRTISTECMRGTRTIWFPSKAMTEAGVSGVDSISASTASAPILVAYHTGIYLEFINYQVNEIPSPHHGDNSK